MFKYLAFLVAILLLPTTASADRCYPDISLCPPFTVDGDIEITGSYLGDGTIRGLVHGVVSSGNTDSPTADEMKGVWHVATNAAGCDYTLPTAVAGYSACFYDYNGGGVVTLDAAAGDEIILNGVGVGTADAIDSAGDIGDFICLFAVDDTDWLTLGRSGTWVDGGAD